jgi:hypothetical protein
MKRLYDIMSNLSSLLMVGTLTIVIILVFSGYGNGSQSANFQSPIQTAMPSRSASTPRVHPKLPTATPLGHVPVYVGTPPTSTPRPGEVIMPDKSIPTATSTPMPITSTPEAVSPAWRKGLGDLAAIQRVLWPRHTQHCSESP